MFGVGCCWRGRRRTDPYLSGLIAGVVLVFVWRIVVVVVFVVVVFVVLV